MALEDVYKRLLLAKGGSEVKAIELNSKNIANINFKNDYAYRLAKLIRPNLTAEDLDIRVINEDKTIKTKSFMVRPDTHVDAGAYIIYDIDDSKKDEKSYIITEYEDNLISPEARGTRCNQKLKLPNLPSDFREGFPCIVANDSYGSKLLSDNELLTMSDEKCNIVVQANQYFLSVKPNHRFIFMNSKYGIFRVFSINTSFKDGTITYICRKDLYKDGLDDLENNLAWQSDYMTEDDLEINSGAIVGEDSVRVGEIKTFKMTGEMEIVWEITDPDVCNIETSGDKYCNIKAIKPNGVCILVAKNGANVVAQRVIITER